MIAAHAEIVIAAPPEAIWQAMVDFNAYTQWNSFIFRVEGDLDAPAVGSKIMLHVRWADGSQTTSAEQISVMQPPNAAPGERKHAVLAYRFTGGLARLGLVRATREQTLEELPDGRTRYWTEERFSGLLARFVPLAKVQEGFSRQANDLMLRVQTNPPNLPYPVIIA